MPHRAKPIPRPPLALADAPWSLTYDGTILDAEGTVVCVLGHPEDALTEQDLANGAAILAIPEMLAALKLAGETLEAVPHLGAHAIRSIDAALKAATAENGGA